MATNEEVPYIQTIPQPAFERLLARRQARFLDYEAAGDNRAETVRPLYERALEEKKRRQEAGLWDE